jgi:hypothetical protein
MKFLVQRVLSGLETEMQGFRFALTHQNFEIFTLESVKMATLSLFFENFSFLEPENDLIQRAQSKIRICIGSTMKISEKLLKIAILTGKCENLKTWTCYSKNLNFYISNFWTQKIRFAIHLCQTKFICSRRK